MFERTNLEHSKFIKKTFTSYFGKNCLKLKKSVVKVLKQTRKRKQLKNFNLES